MSSNDSTLYNNLFSSIISDIKSYNGDDPLLPWLRGIRKMKDSLQPQVLKEKLPRFLQKCSETFLADTRYSNDLRYIRVWLQLMDFVDDPKGVLRTMEMNHVGIKKSLFYLAYALYYEKIKKFDAAEKIYHLGVQNAAEPADELQKSYELFLHRMERHKNKRTQGRKVNGKSLCAGRVFLTHDKVRPCLENVQKTDCKPEQTWEKEHLPEMQSKLVNIGSKMVQTQRSTDEIPMIEVRQGGSKNFYSEDTVLGKFVDTAIIGKSTAEDSRHHGLVEPTINTKEAINDINSMFRKPLEPSISDLREDRNKSKTGNFLDKGLEVFTNESSTNAEVGASQQNLSKDSIFPQPKRSDANDRLKKPFEIYVDSEKTHDAREEIIEKVIHVKTSGSVRISSSHANDSSFAYPSDIPPECLKEPSSRRATETGPREDTVVYRFVGSTIADDPEVENVWHHGLVDPTINLKEAMSDINSMFGKSIEFRRKSRPNWQTKVPNEVKCGQFLVLPDDELDDHKAVDDVNCTFQEPRNQNEVPNHQAQFLILPDDELVNMQYNSLPSLSSENRSDLFEQTPCTKKAVTEINRLFAMPMDF